MAADSLVHAVCKGFPEDRQCTPTTDREKWYKIVGNIMYVPTIQILRANFRELDKYSEAVNNFKHHDLSTIEYDWKVPFSIVSAESLYHLAMRHQHVVISADIECRYLGWDDNTILCIGFFISGMSEALIVNDFSLESCMWLQRVFDSKKHFFVWHNGKFDAGRLDFMLGIKARVDEDTSLMHFVGINEKKGTHKLKELAPLYLQAPRWDDELNDYKNKYCRSHGIKVSDFMYDMIPTSILYPYLAMDVRATLELYKLFSQRMRPNSQVAYRILLRASNAYKELECTGILVDLDYINNLHLEMIDEIQDAEDELEAVAKRYWDPTIYAIETGAKVPGKYFNHKSPKQLKWLLETATGTKLVSTDKDALEELAIKFPKLEVLHALGKLRKHNKYLDTYVISMRESICKDGRIRCSFNLQGTETGRLSSSGPNMHNIPRNKRIKNMFVASEGYKFVQLDYSQAELRVLAYLSGDEFLTQVYLDDEDLHNAVALKMFGPGFTKEQRVWAKTINFGIAYGRGPGSLCQVFGIDMFAAKKLISDWYKPMPGVKAWIDKTRNEPLKGIVTPTIFGRERNYIITNENRNSISNQAANFPIQSIASDMTVMSLCDIQDIIVERGWQGKVRIVNTVHDSIVIEVLDDYHLLLDVMQIGKDIMSKQADKLPGCRVPFKADAEIGDSWGALEDGTNMSEEDLSLPE